MSRRVSTSRAVKPHSPLIIKTEFARNIKTENVKIETCCAHLPLKKKCKNCITLRHYKKNMERKVKSNLVSENEAEHCYEKFKNNIPEDIEKLTEMTEYEKLRERNIEERKTLLQQLNIDKLKNEAAVAAGILFVDDNKYVPSKRGLGALAQTKEFLPARKSLRLQGIDADSGLKLPEKEPTAYFMYDTTENSRHELRDLELSEFISAKDKDAEDVSNYLTRIASSLNTKEEESKQSYFHNNVSKRLKELKITAEQVAKVAPNRIFSLAVHPTEAKLLIAAGGKFGGLGIWDVNDQTSKTHGVHLFSPHTSPINCLTFNEHVKSKLISTSYDGTMRGFDIENQNSVLYYGLKDEDDGYLTSHCQKDPSTFLVAGRFGRNKYSNGIVGVVDTRTSNNELAHVFSVFAGGSARTVSIHPTKRDLFVCQGGRGSASPCKLFDMRGKHGGTNVLTPVTEFVGNTKSINSAYLSPLTGEKLVTVAYDHKIRIYDVDNQAQSKSPAVEVAHNNHTGRWLTKFRAVWHPMREDLLFIGSMNHPRQIDALSDKGVYYPSLKGEHLGTICCIVACHPTQDIVIGGNASGRVHIFK